jgi:hypothetical protein
MLLRMMIDANTDSPFGHNLVDLALGETRVVELS